ncbi:GNAT family N-acetyltransferase [Corynebacterium pseudokroppenstedtii]|uniref:N-acetylglutamate synthase, CG3035 family n=1 Tax=Corynebacterium pseudokroppenstedtii TaxID=2804917 RepID=UPI001F38B79F|nr:GNAT family N-acetyltransferase [Corynebacterium pseudokroppenstedtii]MCF6794035.1 GNAT family N-acetyltransferase [Corynebacterium pseudokroppenstedtii]
MADSTPARLPISRWSDPASLVVGARVVIRRRLTDASPHGNHFTDVIGTLVSLDPLVVRRQNTGIPGEEITIDPQLIDVIKPLPAKPVRNSDIRAVEYAYALAFPGVIHHEWVNGWLVRVGDGVTERSNSAVPLEPHTAFDDVPVDAIHDIYRKYGLPTLIAAPDRIARPAFRMPGAWTRGPEIITMTKDLETEPASEGAATGAAVTGGDSAKDDSAIRNIAAHTVSEELLSRNITWEVAQQPNDDWLSLYHFRGQPLPESALRQLSHEIDGLLGFGRIVIDGETVAITRGTITHSPDGRAWLGYSAVEVAERYRRQGLGTLMGAIMMDWGRRHGANTAYLHVIESNTPGRNLYHKLGFGEHHRHRYLSDASTARTTAHPDTSHTK